MKALPSSVAAAIDYIAAHQHEDGPIPWFAEGTMDPWDLVECAMALDVGGRHAQAQRAYRWLREAQNPDGSLWAVYKDGMPLNRTKDPNISSYLAVGVWHHYLLTGDRAFLEVMWPTVARAIDFSLRLQGEHGGIYWAADDRDHVWPDCLVAASASVRAAILCAQRIAQALGAADHHRWERGRRRLETALLEREEEFGHTFGKDESRFAMAWYYPVLCGVVQGKEGQRRLDSQYRRFLEPGLGVRCVRDRPWVTIAESCELAMALDVVGRRQEGRQLLGWQLAWQEEDGGFRTGTVAGQAWPEGERPTWTAAAVVLAADALYDLTAGGALFRSLQKG